MIEDDSEAGWRSSPMRARRTASGVVGTQWQSGASIQWRRLGHLPPSHCPDIVPEYEAEEMDNKFQFCTLYMNRFYLKIG